jgi:hypothetical protein
MSDFYIGYSAAAPDRLAWFLRRIILLLVCGVVFIAALLVLGQHPFASSRFDYGKKTTASGTLLIEPVPLLVDNGRSYLLVAEGKHGAYNIARAFEGQSVSAEGELIQRGDTQMLQVRPQSIHASAVASQRPVTRDLGDQLVEGELVDTKCYLGVMNPGEGKVHRDCAARCISGDVPAAIVGGEEVITISRKLSPQQRNWIRAHAGEQVVAAGRIVMIDTAKMIEVAAIRLRQ